MGRLIDAVPTYAADGTKRSARVLRQLPSPWTTVTQIGMNSGDRTIMKITIGNSIGLLAFSAERKRWFLLSELAAEFVGKNLWAHPHVGHVDVRPTFDVALSAEDEPISAPQP